MTEAGEPGVGCEQSSGVPSPDAPVATSSAPQPQAVEIPKLLLACLIVMSAALVTALHLQSFFEDAKFSGILISAGLRGDIRGVLPRGLPLAPIFAGTAAVALVTWLIGAGGVALITATSWRCALWRWGIRYLWFSALALFETLRAVIHTASPSAVDWLSMLVASLPFFHTITWAGWFAAAICLVAPPRTHPNMSRRCWRPQIVWCLCAIYAATFSTLSILQYESLVVPHGDTAMYEEHLWNLLHGKGFRSQLDDGRLFFGEHLEVIHLFLLPVYLIYPHLATLNVCLSAALASGGIAVFGIARRMSGSASVALWLTVAYLLYFPLQYLNLEVSLKTFRPENFGVPLLLFAIWSLEAGRFRTMLALLGLTLLCKEDYAIPVAMLGMYLALRWRGQSHSRRSRLLGVGIFLFSIFYLWFVLDVFIPYFRGGPPHYMAYYPELGRSPSEVVSQLFSRPQLFAKPLTEPGNFIFVLMLVIPLALAPVAGAGRLWLLGPSLGTILWIQLPDARSPFFHFHAPLLPVLFWAAAEGVSRAGSWRWKWPWSVHDGLPCHEHPASDTREADRPEQSCAAADYGPNRSLRWARLAAMCALVSGSFFGKSPLSFGFYDPHMEARGYVHVLYAPTGIALERVRAFDKMLPLIPQTASVAATDYIRPRFTHHRECHQYGEGGLKGHVHPDRIDYIVIDLLGPYSDLLHGARVRERDADPDRWEIVHWDPYGELFFLVVRARRPESG